MGVADIGQIMNCFKKKESDLKRKKVGKIVEKLDFTSPRDPFSLKEDGQVNEILSVRDDNDNIHFICGNQKTKEFRIEEYYKKMEKNDNNNVDNNNTGSNNNVDNTTIIDKNEKLFNIIQLNKLILKTYDKSKNNYFHIQSIKNAGERFEEERNRESKEIDYLIEGLKKAEKMEKKAIEHFQEKYELDFSKKETFLYLRYLRYQKLKDEGMKRPSLTDEGMKWLSLIRFTDLKYMDLAGNDITSIDFLDKMNLPYLECFNVSHNKIQVIEPIIYLNSKYLKEIDFQDNKITDIKPLLQCKFPRLELLRIEGNKIDKSSEDFKKLVKNCEKNKTDLIHEIQSIEKFMSDYKVTIPGDMRNIILSDQKRGDKMLRDLYLIISDLKKNPVRQLKLNNNDINDASILARIYWPRLKILNLTLNKLKNVRFLKEMNCRKLSELYLDYNLIKDISPIRTFLADNSSSDRRDPPDTNETNDNPSSDRRVSPDTNETNDNPSSDSFNLTNLCIDKNKFKDNDPELLELETYIKDKKEIVFDIIEAKKKENNEEGNIEIGH